jgi:subtilisin family serine protease
MYHTTLDVSLALQKVHDAWQEIGGLEAAGQGIKIAIIDTGIDASHPAFQDSGLTIPDGFPRVNRDSDLEYTNNKVIVARAYSLGRRRNVSAEDTQGHGTAVAMVAAGVPNDAPLARITGAAPKAWLGAYKVFPDANGAPNSLIIRAIEDAVNDGMDVINLSLGGYPAVRPSEDDVVLAVENAVLAGKVVVVSAGNQGSVPNTVSSPGTSPSAITVGSSLNGRVFAAKVSLDSAEFPSIPGDGANSEEPILAPLKDVSEFDPTALACDVLPEGSLAGLVAVISRGTCLFEMKLNNAKAAGAVAAIVYAPADAPVPFGMAVGEADLPAVMVSYSDGQVLRQAAGNAETATVGFTVGAVAVNSAHLATSSSRGPSSDLGIKPEVLGIGQGVYTAQPVSKAEQYVVLSGTSFSAPTIAGAAALLMSARPGLTAEQYRSMLVNATSVFSEDEEQPLAVQYAGTGLLNMTATLSSTLAVAPVSLSFGAGGSTVDTSRNLKITNLGAAPDTFSVVARPIGEFGPLPELAQNTIELGPGETHEIPVRFTGDGIEPGSYQGWLEVQGTHSMIARVPYWYGIPSQQAVHVQLFEPPETVTRGRDFRLYFRLLDAAGLPVTEGVDATIFTSGEAVAVDSNDADVPGSFVATMHAPSEPGKLLVRIEVGGLVRDLSIAVD